MEKNVSIRSGKYIVHGTLNSAKSEKLVIFVHGLSGNRNEHIFYNGARFFCDRGFDVFRFDLYSGEKKGRNLSECTLKDHITDTNAVISYFKPGYKKIFLVGHSYGGPAVLKTDISLVSGIVLWDPTSSMINWTDEAKYSKELDAYTLSWGSKFIISREMYEEGMNLPTPRKFMDSINVPVKIICAGKGILVKSGRVYYKYAKEPREFAIIGGAGHNFDEEGAEDKLFAETRDFLEKY